jgi:hypothetical protein
MRSFAVAIACAMRINSGMIANVTSVRRRWWRSFSCNGTWLPARQSARRAVRG